MKYAGRGTSYTPKYKNVVLIERYMTWWMSVNFKYFLSVQIIVSYVQLYTYNLFK
jgi:hypothetical protein